MRAKSLAAHEYKRPPLEPVGTVAPNRPLKGLSHVDGGLQESRIADGGFDPFLRVAMADLPLHLFASNRCRRPRLRWVEQQQR